MEEIMFWWQTPCLIAMDATKVENVPTARYFGRLAPMRVGASRSGAMVNQLMMQFSIGWETMLRSNVAVPQPNRLDVSTIKTMALSM